MSVHPAVAHRLETASNPHWWVSGPQAVTAACVVAHQIVGDDGAIVALAGHESDLRGTVRGVWRMAHQLRLNLGEVAPDLGVRLLREHLDTLARALPDDQITPAQEGVEALIDGILRDQTLTRSGRLLEVLFIPHDHEDVVALRLRVSETCREFDLGPLHWQLVYEGGATVAVIAVSDRALTQVFAGLGGIPMIAAVQVDIERRALEMMARARYPQATEAAIAEWADGAATQDPWAIAWRQGRTYRPGAQSSDHHEVAQRLMGSAATAPLYPGYAVCFGGPLAMPQWWSLPQCCLDVAQCSRQRIEILEELLYEAATQASQVCRPKVLLVDAHTWETAERSTVAERLARDGRKYRVSVVVCASGPARMPVGPLAEHIGNTVMMNDAGATLCGLGSPIAVGQWYTDDVTMAARMRVGGMG